MPTRSRTQSGIHQDGVLKERSTYEIIDPADVGVGRLEHRADRAQRASRAASTGSRSSASSSSDEEFEPVYEAFLELADKKKEVYDEDLEALVGEQRAHAARGLPPRDGAGDVR